MRNIKFSKGILSQLLMLLIILIVALTYFYPQLEGKDLSQLDISHFRGMSKELADYKEKTGENALWTNAMFSGMPSFLIGIRFPGNITRFIQDTLRYNLHPAAMLILYLVGFYILLSVLGLKKWQSLIGAFAYGFSTYFLLIIEAGHNTKAYALGYFPIIFAGMLLVFRGKRIPGLIIFTISLSLNILVNHLQITYYALITALILAVVMLIDAIKKNELNNFVKGIILLIVGAVIAVGLNFSRLITTYQYSQKSIRGPSELTTKGDNQNQTSGLDKDYVVQYSLGIDETLTLLIPDYMGGGSYTNPGVDSESYKVLQQRTQNARQNIEAVSMYHGGQPPTAGPVYIGAIVIFLFIISLFIVKGPIKWWLVSASLLSLMLSWGDHFMVLTNFFLHYVPLYNKFRAPTMMLIIVQFAVPLLAFVGLNKLLKGEVDKVIFLRGFKWAAIIAGGITLIFAVFPSLSGDFTHPGDTTRYPEWLIDAILADRKHLLQTDSLRSFVLIAISAVTLYGWHLKKIKSTVLIAVLGVLILGDLWFVDKRYLNADNFTHSKQVEKPFPKTVADKEILKDKDLSYRVLPYSRNVFQDASASYFHKNVGGYHAAKLRRYQDLIDSVIYPELESLATRMQQYSSLDTVFSTMSVLNMLNTRYIIVDDGRQPPLRNPKALGNAWFVDNYKVVENANAEIAAVQDFNSATTAIIDKRFENFVEGKSFRKDVRGGIKLTEYEPNYLKYDYQASSEQLVVFSEIYYADGWDAFLDGEKVPHFRVDYVLRAMVVPAGKHTIEFRFEPKMYYLGNKIAYASSIVLLLLVFGYIGNEIKKYLNRKKAIGEEGNEG